MITVEIMMIICFILYGFALYIMYRYFNDIIDGMYDEISVEIKSIKHFHSEHIKNYCNEPTITSFACSIEDLKHRLGFAEVYIKDLEDKLKLNPEIQKPKTRKVRKEKND